MTKTNIDKIAFLLNHPVMIDHYMSIWKILDKNKFTIVVTENFKKSSITIYNKIKKEFNLIDFNYCLKKKFFFKIVVSNQPIEIIKKKINKYNLFSLKKLTFNFKNYSFQILGNLIGNLQVKYSYGLDINYSYNIMPAIYYDYIFCISKFELNQYKKNFKNKKYLSRKKNYRDKKYYITGYPKYDDVLFNKKKTIIKTKREYYKKFNLNKTKKTILWISGDLYNSSIYKQYQNYIFQLSSNYNFILRPHPRHLNKEKSFLKKLKIKNNFYISEKIDQNMKELYSIADYVFCDYGGSLFSSIYLKKKYILLPLCGQSLKKEAIGEGNELKVHKNFKKSFGKMIQKNSILELMTNNKFWKKQGLFNDKLRKYYFGTRNTNSVIDLKKKLLSILKNN